MSGKDKTWIGASDIGQTSYCEKSFEFKSTKQATNQKSQARMEEGTNSHNQLNASIRQSQQRTSNKTGCFIATEIYGISDYRTNILREWRDNKLSNITIGKIFIKNYYRYSPYLVRLIQKVPFLRPPLKVILDNIIKIINKEN